MSVTDFLQEPTFNYLLISLRFLQHSLEFR